jgi:rod shape-determining protein MreD
MKYFIYLALLIILLALNSEFAAAFFSLPIRLNLLLLPVVFSALDNNQNDYLFLAFGAGLLFDFYNASPFGVWLFSFLLVGAFLSWIARTFLVYKLDLKIVPVLVLVAFVCTEAMIIVFSKVFPGHENFSFEIVGALKRSALTAPVEMALALPAYFLWAWVLRLIAKTEVKKLSLK